MPVDFTALVAAVTAIGALGTAAFALVDATKAFGGGISLVGLSDVRGAAARFSAALDAALDPGVWKDVVRDHWINGRPKGEQKAILKALVRLGLNPDSAPQLAAAAHVDPAALRSAVEKLREGTPLAEGDVNVLGRLDASVDAYLDAAFDRADQKYRNSARVLAGGISVALALFAASLAPGTASDMNLRCGGAVLAGLLAVPFSPIAKDLTSALQSAVQAVKATRAVR